MKAKKKLLQFELKKTLIFQFKITNNKRNTLALKILDEFDDKYNET